MSRYKLFGCLMLAQGIALALGLWIHHRFTAESVAWQASRDGAADIVPTENNAPLKPAADHSGTIVAAYALAFLWILGLQGLVGYLVLSRIIGEHSRWQHQSNEQSLQKARALVRTRDAVIFGLAKLAESRDPETGHHLERIALYSTRLAEALRHHPRFQSEITPTFLRLIGISSALHDIGKVGIEDSVLLKPGRLTSDERFRMQVHATLGGECIRKIEHRLGDSNFLEMAREIALYHHERWDGAGYPTGLAGDQIPLAARIVAVADVYDALSVRRVYKEPYPHERCVNIIRSEAGTQFDPEIVKVFLEIEGEFREIARRFGDEAVAAEHAEQAFPLTMTATQELVLRTAVGASGSALAAATAAEDEPAQWDAAS